jgi:hypothetical protein
MTDSEDPGRQSGYRNGAHHHRARTAMPVPAMIAGIGARAALRSIDFSTAHIRNPNMRAAYPPL